jgi:hypothetical protein
MIKKILPNTAPQVLNMLNNTFDKTELFPDKTTMPLPKKYYDQLIIYLPILKREMRETSNALVAQMVQSSAKWMAFDRTEMFFSHFVQGFNNGILRGEFPIEHRRFYNIDVNSSKIPDIDTETQLKEWATNLKEGDAARVAAGGKPMSNPTAAEVEAQYQVYFVKSQAQSGLKDAYKEELKDVTDILPQDIKLCRDISAELEHFYREETDSRKRELCREWGMVYKVVATNAGGEPIEPLTGTLAPLSKATIMEGGFDVNTSFLITNNGLVPLRFYTILRADGNVPDTYLELAAGMQKEVFAGELGAEGNTFLMVYNPSETSEGLWEVVEVE